MTPFPYSLGLKASTANRKDALSRFTRGALSDMTNVLFSYYKYRYTTLLVLRQRNYTSITFVPRWSRRSVEAGRSVAALALSFQQPPPSEIRFAVNDHTPQQHQYQNQPKDKTELKVYHSLWTLRRNITVSGNESRKIIKRSRFYGSRGKITAAVSFKTNLCFTCSIFLDLP